MPRVRQGATTRPPRVHRLQQSPYRMEDRNRPRLGAAETTQAFSGTGQIVLARGCEKPSLVRLEAQPILPFLYLPYSKVMLVKVARTLSDRIYRYPFPVLHSRWARLPDRKSTWWMDQACRIAGWAENDAHFKETTTTDLVPPCPGAMRPSPDEAREAPAGPVRQ